MKPIIETRDLTIRFGSLIANDRLNISIEPGKIHAIAGENGAGKSTLMKMLYGVYTPTSGKILIDGEEMRAWDASMAIAKGIHMVFQDFPFDSCLYRSGKHFYFSGKQQLCHEKAAAPQTNP